MEAPRPHLVLLPGGKPRGAAQRRSPSREHLRLLAGGPSAEVERALADAIEAARQMRLEIERRIARALDAFDDRR